MNDTTNSNSDGKDVSYYGHEPDQGLIDLVHGDEGFATLVCGGTEVKIGFTILHMLCNKISTGQTGDYQWSDTKDLYKAVCSITCEASLGRKGGCDVKDDIGEE